MVSIKILSETPMAIHELIRRVQAARRQHGSFGASKRAARRLSRGIQASGIALALRARNRFSQARILGTEDAIVSMTTYGPRIRTVDLTIESIGRGVVKPSRLILWLDDRETVENPPKRLRRLAKRGLEIRHSDNYGPHKKYFPAIPEVLSSGLDRLVTIDDDVICSRHWLEEMMDECKRSPETIVAYRARVVTFNSEEFASWSDWPLCKSSAASLRNMAIGEAGVAYPRAAIEALSARGSAFLAIAPRTDDIWLHATAVSVGVPTRQVAARPLHPLIVPGTQRVTLSSQNVDSSGNDTALSANYDLSARQKIQNSEPRT